MESLARFGLPSTIDADFHAAMVAVENALARTMGTDCTWSHRLPARLAGCGLGSVGADVHLPVTGLINASASCWSLTLRQLAPRIIALGLLDAATLDRVHRQLSDPAFADVGLATMTAWGRRPPISAEPPAPEGLRRPGRGTAG